MRLSGWLRGVGERALQLLSGRRRRRELDDEMAFHLEQLEQRYRRQGLSPEAARKRAEIQFGRPSKVREEVRDATGVRPILDFATDLRHAVRVLRRRPAHTATAVLSLAIGIGTLTALLTVVDGVVLRPLPFPEPEQLFVLWGTVEGEDTRFGNASAPDLEDWRRSSSSWTGVAAFNSERVELGGEVEPDLVRIGRVTSDFFATLGARTVAGRLPTAGEFAADGRVALVEEGAWRRRFAADAAAIGSTVRLGENVYTLVGVVEGASLRFPSDTEFWVPIEAGAHRGSRSLTAIGRLHSNTLPAVAQDEMNTIAARLAAAHPDSNADRSVRLISLHEHVTGGSRAVLSLFLGAAALVFLVTAANTAHLTHAVSAERATEMAVRRALGAGRGRLLRYLMTESLVLGALGALLGVALCAIFIRVGSGAQGLPLPRLDTLGLSLATAVAAVVLAVAAAVIVGVGPAMRGSTQGVATFSSTGKSGSSRRSGTLLVGQMAVTFVLLFGAAVLLRSLWALERVDPGLDSTGVATFRLTLPGSRYAGGAEVMRLHAALDGGLRSLPGVTAVGATAVLPFGNGSLGDRYAVDGRSIEPDSPSAQLRGVLGDYFEAVGIPILEGTRFQSGDSFDTPPVAIVNQTLASAAWPGQSPVGKTIIHFGAERRVVGVTGDVRGAGLSRMPLPTVYVPFLQRPTRFMSYVVDSERPADTTLALVRDVVHEIDPQLPLEAVATLDDHLQRSLGSYRLRAGFLAVLGAIALVLAGVGIYGLSAHLVAGQRYEIGVRMALGASRRRVLRELMFQGLGRVALGITLGALGAVWVGRWLSAFAYEISGTDPLALALAAGALTMAGLLGCWRPGRRATRVSPVEALRPD